MRPLHTILHATDFSPSSREAFRLACFLARDQGARLIVLHVTTLPDLAYTGYGVPGSPLSAKEYLEKVHHDLEQLLPPDPRVPLERRLKEGDPVAEILRVAADTNADLIVLGTHGQNGLGHLLMGSVAEHVVRRAPCPVLTLKTPAGAAASA